MMASVHSQSRIEEDEKERSRGSYGEIISTLPIEKSWIIDVPLYQHQGFWYYASIVEGIMWVQQHFNFKARQEDVLLVSFPKSGTTWLKSLTFAIMNRPQSRSHALKIGPVVETKKILIHDSWVESQLSRVKIEREKSSSTIDGDQIGQSGSGSIFKTAVLSGIRTLFQSCSPHELVPFLEFYLHDNIPFPNIDHPDMNTPSSAPHLFHTHIPCTSLPQLLIHSECRIVYICRDPKDVFVSTFCFHLNSDLLLSLEDAFNKFCTGISVYGPFWDHMLGYWKESLASPQRVLFLKYEDVKRDSLNQVKRLAEFVGRPFSSEEEEEGLIHEIVELCSFENLRNLGANKTGAIDLGGVMVGNDAFFRKGESGDWMNHLSVEMANRLDRMVEEKFEVYGLTFSDSSVL